MIQNNYPIWFIRPITTRMWFDPLGDERDEEAVKASLARARP